MPQAARGHRHRLALGKQSAEGTAQATAAFEYSLYDGSMVPEQDVRQHEISGSTDLPGGPYVAGTVVKGSPVLTTHPQGMGLPLFAHFGLDTVTPAPPNYTHTMTRLEAKPFLTGYWMYPGPGGGAADRWMRSLDTLIPAVEFMWNQGDPVKFQTEMLGKTPRWNVTAPTVTTQATTMANYFHYIGATVKLDSAATPASTIIRNIISGTIRSEYENTEWEWTDDVTPYALDLGRYNCTVSMDAKLDSYAIQSLAYFGAATGADLDATRITTTGSFSILFQKGPATDVFQTLEIQIPSLRWTASWPELDTGGGPVTMTLDGGLVAPASGEAITVILKNQTASY